ncbi:MAG TPA: NAD(P)-dependent oxidoreductase [Gaiellaceae bacterium]|nr:NAD(P)-dependent oxidoreductase [Gaiellaceae bacterium]
MTVLLDELVPPLATDEAIVEADRCLECGGAHAPAPCVVACPAGVDVPGFVTAVAAGDPVEAGRIVFGENLLGGSCARVCPAELLCEGACVLAHEGRRPVAVARLQRFACDEALTAGPPPRRRMPFNWLRVAVIGAGPAGLACAGELAALGYEVTVYDERIEPGGLVRYAIAPYRLEREPLPHEARLLAELGVHLELGIAVDTAEALAEIEADADALVLAIGMGADADVRYPGDELAGVWDSLPFIERLKTGEPPDVGDSVAVVGGGNTAIDVARESLRLGAGRVTLLYRRTREEMPAYPHEVDEAEHEGVEIEWLTVPVRLVGSERVEAVECRRARLGKRDASGRRRPEEIPGSEFLVAADTVVKAVGQQPRSGFLALLPGLELADGLLVADPETGRTARRRTFACGDATNGGATVVEAVRQGKIAARGIHEELKRGWA